MRWPPGRSASPGLAGASSPACCCGACPWPILALGPAAALAYLALVVVGIGNAVVDVACFTLVTRLAGPRTAGKVLGALEFVALAGLATGSILTPLLLHAFGVRGTLALLGGGLAGLALAHAVRFRRLDRAMPAPGPEAGLLRNLPMFAPLPLAVTELLAAEIEPRQFPAGAVVMREGEPGDHFYLIVEGSAAVSVQARPGHPFTGEIASARSRCFATSRGRRPSPPSNPCIPSPLAGNSSSPPSPATPRAGRRPMNWRHSGCPPTRRTATMDRPAHDPTAPATTTAALGPPSPTDGENRSHRRMTHRP